MESELSKTGFTAAKRTVWRPVAVASLSLLAFVGVAVSSSFAQTADLVTTIVDSPDPVVDGANITYTVTIQNNGPGTVQGVNAQFICNNGTFVSTDVPPEDYFVSNEDRVVQVFLEGMPPEGARTFELVFKARKPGPEHAQQVTLSSNVGSELEDPNNNNNNIVVTTGFSGGGGGGGEGEIIYGVTTQRELITFSSSNPSNILSTTPITGLTDQNNSESVRAIDFRPATGELYAVGNAPGGIFRLYKINPSTGVATQIGGNLQGVPLSLGMNFEPTTDVIRIVSDAEQNFRYNPDTAALISSDGSLAYASGDPGFGRNPNVVTVSYTNSVAGATTTTAYVIDTQRDVVATLQPNSGVMSTVGQFGLDIGNYANPASLEISGLTGKAYATVNDPGTQTTLFFNVDLATGAASAVGQVGSNAVVRSIAVPPTAPTPTPTPTPTPGSQRQIWFAGGDLAANERTDAASETNATNATVPEWSYGYRGAITGTQLTPFAPGDHTNNFSNNSALQGWAANQGIVVANTGSVAVAGQAAPFTPFDPLPPEQMLVYRQAISSFPVVRWTVPASGHYRISAKWFDWGGRGIGAKAHVVIDGKEVFGRQIIRSADGAIFFDGQDWTDGGNAMMPLTTFELNAGSVVDFVFSDRPNTAGSGRDPTAFSAIIRRVPKVAISAPATAVRGDDSKVTVTVEHNRRIKSVQLQVDLGTATAPLTAPPYEFALRDLNLDAATHSFAAVVVDEDGLEALTNVVDVLVKPARLARREVSSGTSLKIVEATADDDRIFQCTRSGLWTDPATWGGKGVPGRHDHAIIPKGFEVSIPHVVIELNNLDIAGSITGVNAFQPGLYVYGTMHCRNATLRNGDTGITYFVAPGGKLIVSDGLTYLDDATFFNNGETAIGSNGSFLASRNSIVRSNGVLRLPEPRATNRPTILASGEFKLEGGRVELGIFAQITASGRIVAAGGGNIVAAGGGNIVAAGGGNIVAAGGGNLVGADGASLVGADGASLVSIAKMNIVAAGGGNIVAAGGGNIVAAGGGNIVAAGGGNVIGTNTAGLVGDNGSAFRAGSVAMKSATALGESISTAAEADPEAVLLESGSLTGNFTVGGSLTNRGAFIAPGNSAGSIQVVGDYTQESGGALLLEAGGTNTDPLQFDQLTISGTANLGGSLIVKTINGFTPQSGDSFAPITYAAVNGQFDSVTSNAQISFGANGATMQVSGPNPPAPKALNIATRMRVEAGDNVLIAGFIITGDQPKRVLIRGIGPSLPVSGALADTTLDLDGGTFFNDDWKTDQEQEIRDTTIPPSSDLESAIVATLDPGAHTAVLRGKDGITGIGLVEVYDLESGAPAQLANIATRGLVQTGDDVMIGGFIIGGNYPAKVLIRAIGPSLPVDGRLEDPMLELVDSNGSTISNDDWRTSQESEIVGTTIPPTNEKEAAIVATLVPGAYTAIVRGKDDTTGIALVEGYNLQ